MRAPSVREAEADDAPAIAILLDQLGYPAIDATQVASRMPMLQAAGGRILVAEIDDKVIACLTTSVMQVLHRPRPVGRISMFVVQEDLRGRGIGKTLLSEAQQMLRSQGCEMLEVTSNVRRHEAHAFYEHLGWERSSYRFSRED